MQYYKIEIDEKIWNFLKSAAEPFEGYPKFGIKQNPLWRTTVYP